MRCFPYLRTIYPVRFDYYFIKKNFKGTCNKDFVRQYNSLTCSWVISYWIIFWGFFYCEYKQVCTFSSNVTCTDLKLLFLISISLTTFWFYLSDLEVKARLCSDLGTLEMMSMLSQKLLIPCHVIIESLLYIV